jgi:hypothetical protein
MNTLSHHDFTNRPMTPIAQAIAPKARAPTASSAVSAYCARWQRYYEDLCAYQRETGHCRVPRDENCYAGLAGWVARQRRYYKAGTLSAKRIALLEQIGFIWDVYEEAWRANFVLLKQGLKGGGDKGPSGSNPAPQRLGIVVTKMRQRYRSGRLPAGRILALEAIGFDWNHRHLEGEKKNFHPAAMGFRAP